MTGIRVGTRTVLEMNDSINRLDMIALDGPWTESKDLLKRMDAERIRIVQEMTQIGKSILSGALGQPDPSVNYGAMTAHAPELTAQVEQIDKSMFTMAQPIFFGLVDERRLGPDGKVYHLLLTKKERDDMTQLIDNAFGPSLKDKNATHIVNAAWAIKYGLTRPNYKSADEP